MDFAVAENLANDRLVSTLFLATLAHGLAILGISFNIGMFDGAEVAPTLEVVLVNSLAPAADAPEDAAYMALENSLGAGNTAERVRPASRHSDPAPASSPGSPDATEPERTQRGEAKPTLELLATRSLSAFAIVSLREPEDATHEARLMQAAPEPEAPLADTYDETRVRETTPREKIVSVSTRETDIAGYLAGWKRKIEQVGTLNFPALARAGDDARNPILEVAVNAEGYLHDVIIRRSSSLRSVDEAAVEILRLASPFDPFPADMQVKYDVLRFVYEWQFIEGQRTPLAQPGTDSGV